MRFNFFSLLKKPMEKKYGVYVYSLSRNVYLVRREIQVKMIGCNV